uniref:Transmembrane protein n=1 Tax=Timema tahoe TaxID=61484 RepID=A0A7R9NXY1_9NEOP|nr:unnamed protein product [Timema tahoe]
MSQYTYESRLAVLYLASTLLSIVTTVCALVPYEHWREILDVCVDIRCNCMLYASDTFNFFTGGSRILCLFVVFASAPAIVMGVVMASYHGYRVCISARHQHTPNGRKSKRNGEVAVIQSRNENPEMTTPICQCWTTVALLGITIGLLILAAAIILTDGLASEFGSATSEELVDVLGRFKDSVEVFCESLKDFFDILEPCITEVLAGIVARTPPQLKPSQTSRGHFAEAAQEPEQVREAQQVRETEPSGHKVLTSEMYVSSKGAVISGRKVKEGMPIGVKVDTLDAVKGFCAEDAGISSGFNIFPSSDFGSSVMGSEAVKGGWFCVSNACSSDTGVEIMEASDGQGVWTLEYLSRNIPTPVQGVIVFPMVLTGCGVDGSELSSMPTPLSDGEGAMPLSVENGRTLLPAGDGAPPDGNKPLPSSSVSLFSSSTARRGDVVTAALTSLIHFTSRDGKVVLHVSHSLLMSSDRMKPRSGDWPVTINFLKEAAITSLSSGSNVKTNESSASHKTQSSKSHPKTMCKAEAQNDRYSSPMASLVLTDSSQLTSDSQHLGIYSSPVASLVLTDSSQLTSDSQQLVATRMAGLLPCNVDIEVKAGNLWRTPKVWSDSNERGSIPSRLSLGEQSGEVPHGHVQPAEKEATFKEVYIFAF